ncbi:MAG: processing protein [Blastocatellia bacterium]|jgi:DNA processing protein|nr:processing protein [Blastocatellia bacterium]
MRPEHIDLLALCRIKGVSWYLIAREARRPDGLERLIQGAFKENTLETVKAKAAIIAARLQFSELQDEACRELESAAAEGISITTVLDEDYPLNLRMIYNLPPFLFYQGKLDAEQDALSVAVVGTRAASAEGLKRANKMARMLSERGITVLSGLAFGIDTQAHNATLDAGGRTVSVIGSGLRQIYPKENRGLAEQIAQTGALVSQFWLDARPTTYSFPRRNITMSGMGQGTVVIEASKTSGAKMQARLAQEHGKRVFLVSQLVTQQKWAQDYLKRPRVTEVRDIEDIIKQLDTVARIRLRTEQAQQLSLSL